MKNNVFYYQRELNYLHETREYFIKYFPKLAPFLAYNSKDPDVERIIENLAILTSKIHQELDENIPHIAESLINIIAPNYTNSLPSLCMQEFNFDKKNKENKLIIPKGTIVKSKAIDKCICEFQTIYDVYLYPLSIKEVFLGSKNQDYTLNLKMQIDKTDTRICDLNLDKMVLYLGNEIYSSTTLLLYVHSYLKELKIQCLDTNEEFKLGIYDIEKIGLENEESALFYNDLGFESFSLLREYFFLPQKFNFFKIKGLDILRECQGREINIEFKFSKPFPKNCLFRKELFSLSMTPIINIFKKSAEPFINDNKRNGYRIFIDRTQPNAYEIIQILQVKAHNSNGGRRVLKNYKSFERFEFLKEHKSDFYALNTKKNSKGEAFKEISFFSSNFIDETISIETLCSNKNLPSRLQIADINICDLKDVLTKNIQVPSKTRECNIDGNLLWKFVSMLSFSYQTMLNKNAFFGVLESYSFLEDKENEESYRLLKEAIVNINSKSVYLIDEHITKKGTSAIFELKDSCFYSLGEVYRLGLILSKFLSSFASINSFCELTIKCVDSKEILHYPAIFGKKDLI
ncbi:type VI secretion system baseplate subunit TssF [Campylobacter sp. US33a]|uniref:type VI secretion system baseplate subunit TssF n=1 Tax=Campylobacter sp. US33a TaxID=2498120 RepID=UPI00106892B7|nr:type VI secretion system baseplate subunit TssF [Campylobacter sp. US33a]TEY00223.1 type VI secretion system baseplate subunit TssF [Campylobacter sp. US33a]